MSDKISICGMAKNEDCYIEEWVNHYLALGVNHIFIYDNNDSPSKVMKSLECDQVTIIPVNGFETLKQLGYQSGAYIKCYRQHSQEYGWMGFFDIDEFFTINTVKPDNTSYTIGELLSLPKFNDADVLHTNWRYYGDNDLIYNDGRGVKERFINPAPIDVRYAQQFPENRHVKSFIRTNKPFVEINCHTGFYPNCVCKHIDGYNTDAYSCFNNYSYGTAQVSHYGTKTITEFIARKILNMHRASCGLLNNPEDRIKWFFNVNSHTPEKDAIANKVLEQWRKVH